MNPIDGKDLKPDGIYWARRKAAKGEPPGISGELRVVQVSAIFGSTAEFLTVAIIGSDEHFALEEFEFFNAIAAPGTTGLGI